MLSYLGRLSTCSCLRDHRQGHQPFDVPIKIEQGILSGFDQRPLSTLPWHNNASFDLDECEPFNERTHAYLPKSTTPVTILPYRTSPLPLLALRRQIAAKGPRELSVESPTPEAENERLSFDLSKSATMYFAAYPVYVPLYLSQVKCTESDGATSMYTVAIIAYGSSQATSSWASRAMVFDASTEEGDRSGWHKRVFTRIPLPICSKLTLGPQTLHEDGPTASTPTPSRAPLAANLSILRASKSYSI